MLSFTKSRLAGKTKYITLTCFMIFLLAEISLANIRQSNWRWRNDDGNVYTATWKDSLNTPAVLTDYENIRLRIQISFRNPDTSNISLRYTEDVLNMYNDEVWIKINSIDTGKFFIAPSNYLTDQKSFFDNQLLPPWDTNYYYRKTITFDSSDNSFLRGDSLSLYEIEYSIKPTLKIKPGSAYFFALFDGSRRMGSQWGTPPIREYPVIMTPPVNWISQSFETEYTFSYLNDIFFVDAITGFAVGYGKNNDILDPNSALILKTTDGGVNWIQQACPAGVSELNAVCFVNTDIGTAVGSNGIILRTTNGGMNWTKQNSSTPYSLLDVCFINADSGTAISSEYLSTTQSWISSILRTTNGGTTWTKQSYPNKYLQAVCFTDIDKGTIVGSDVGSGEAIILRTTNSGESWFNQSSGISGSLGGVFFNDEKYGFAVGWDNSTGSIILKTMDGGDNWIKVYGEPEPHLSSVQFIDKNTGWAAGNYGWILKTTDGGLSWQKLVSGTSQHLSAVHFVNSEIGWAVGGNRILKTTNGGITTFIEEEKTDYIPESFYLSQNYPNPFNPTTNFEFRIADFGFVTLKVYDVLGNEIATLINEEKPTGAYEVTWNAEGLSSGVYFYQLKAGSFTATKKLLLVK